MTSDPAARSYRVATAETWLAALLFTALAIVFAYPLSLHPATLRFPTGPDGDLGWYLLAWDTHAFLHKPWAIFDANIYYPQRFTLAYGENVIGIAFFTAPVIWLTGNVPLAANFVGLLSTVLCGLGAYVLARRLGLSAAAAVISGIVWELAAPRFFRIGQMTLSSVEWIPFGLAALHAYVDEGRKRDLRLAAAFTSLQVLSSGYGAVFMGVALLIFCVYRAWLGEPLRIIKRLGDLGLVGAALLLPTFLVYLPYLVVQHEAGLRRGLGTWEPNYSAFLASPSHVHQYLLSLLTKTDVNATALAYLFPGYLAIMAALVAIIGARPKISETAGAHGFWTLSTFVFESATLGALVVAALLTIRTLIDLEPEAVSLTAPPGAVLAWILCGSLAALTTVASRRLPAQTVPHSRRPLALLLTVAVGWIALGAARATLHAGDGLLAEYFANPTWSGPPEFVLVDREPSTALITRRWGNPPPQQFSVRWTGFLTTGRSAQHTFATTSDVGSDLTIDNHLVIDNDGQHGLATRTGSIHLRRGSHLVVLRYVQSGGDSALTWSWSRDGESLAVVPAWALSRRMASYLTVVAARMVDWLRWIFAMLTIVTAAWYVRGAYRNRRPEVARWGDAFRCSPTAFYATLTFLTAGLALGPPYGLWQYVYWLPGFTFIRASSRFTIVAMLGLAVLAGIGFDRISCGLSRRRRAILATTIGVLLVVEYAAMPMDVQPIELDIPPIDRWLDNQPKPFVIAEVPVQHLSNLALFERQEVDYMMHSTVHWQKTVHGYSGWRAPFHWQLFAQMQNFPDDTSVGSLSDLAVKYVVVHTDYYPPGEWDNVEKRLRQYSCRLRLEHVEGAGRVYRFLRPDGEVVDRSAQRR